MMLRWCKDHWFWLGLGLAFVLPWIAFGRALVQDFAAIDDAFLIVNNPIVHGMTLAHVKLAFTTFDPELYIPLTLLSFQIDWMLGGGSPVIFHLTNLLLHSLNAVLVGVFAMKLLGGKRGPALAVALLFAVHPLHTEAVVWAAGRKDLLATFFMLLTAIAYVRSNRPALLALSVLLFVFGLLSKVVIATLPAVLLIHALLLRQDEPLRKTVWRLAPFFLLSGVLLFVATFGKDRILASSTLLETMLMAQKSAVFYLQKLLLPTDLTVIYPFQGTISAASPEFFVPLLINLGVLGLALRQCRRRPLISLGILWYYVTLLPTFFNFHKGDLLFFAVDRYAYIPSIGFLLVVVLVAAELFDTFGVTLRNRACVVAAIVVIGVLVSIKQSTVWDTQESLFGRSITLYPESVSARMALGSILRDQNRLTEAFEVLQNGATFSDHPGLNLEAGLVYSAAGQVDDAREQFKIALTKNPHLAPALFYLGFLEEHDRKIAAAIDWYKQAIDEDPSYVTVRVHRALLLIQTGKLNDAEVELRAAYDWNPVSEEVIDAFITLETARNNTIEVQRWEAWKKDVL